jgi:aryl-alcohol dehydrogenase-like predicted oxidoreductase
MDDVVTPADGATGSRCALGLGCVTFGREIDASTSCAMMDHAVARGITFFDTASAYGQGASERIIGQWLKPRGSAGPIPRIATKALPPYTAESLRRSVGGSLERLGTTRLDLLFLHRWDDSLLLPDAYLTLAEMVASGTVGEVGLSNVDETQLESALHQQSAAGGPPFRWLQNIHNYAVQGFTPALRQTCARAGIRLMGYSPLGAGFLTGKHRTGVVAGSRFEVIPGHQAVYFTPEAQRRLARLEQVALESGVSAIDLAFGWALQQPWIDCVLVGGRNTDQIDQAVRARERDFRRALTILDDASG